MTTKIVKKRKLKVFHLLLFILIVAVLVGTAYLVIHSKTKNIIIKNNNMVSDEEIITLAKIEDYPAFYLTSSHDIKKRLKKNPFIKEVKVKRGFYHVFTLDITENKPLFFYEVDKKVVLENKEEVELTQEEPLRIPRVMNYVPNTKYQSLIKNIKKIDEDILGKISEMTYVPNEYDKDRFLLYMDDDNSVYLTLTKFKMINYYNKVLQQLEGKKGVLYLDNGNHFQIKSEG